MVYNYKYCSTPHLICLACVRCPVVAVVVVGKQGTDTALQWERNRKKTVLEYLPKLVLVGLIWVVTILVYM